MRKFKKRLMPILLTLAMAVSTLTFVPQTSFAATPKSTTKNVTVKVSSAKISGFKKIEDTIKVGKYVVAYGTNNKGKNIYAYSTDGKKFSKAKTLGLNGKVYYQTSGKYLYVIDSKNALKASYKCVSDPTKLSSSKAKKITITLPSGYNASNSDLSGWGFADGKNLYLTASFYGYLKDGSYVPYAYSIALSSKGAKVTDVSSKAKSLLKNNNAQLQGSYFQTDYSVKSYHTGVIAKLSTNTNDDEKNYFIYTTNGSTFKTTPVLPASKNEYYDVDWVNGKLMAYRSFAYSDNSSTYTMNSDSKKHGIYYLLNEKTNKWEKKTTGKYTSSSGYAKSVASYSDTTVDKEFLALTETTSKSLKTIISSNGTSWTALPKLNYSLAKDKISRIEYTKTASGTYVEEIYFTDYSYANQKIVVSKLNKGKWQKLRTIDVKNNTKTYYSTEYYAKVPGILYNNGNTTTGYNLKTNKAYVVPFSFSYNQMLGGDSMVFYSGKNLYITKDGYKTFKKISLKSGSKKLTSKITQTSVHSISKKTVNAYIICGAKMYYTTTKQIVNAR